MTKNKKTRREPAQIQPVQAAQNVVTVTDKIPLVSVIIPMYNSAKFIPQTLESLHYQTMTDFEVVVVDDCSTDNSVEVVESFAERFNGRLHVIKLSKNTGTPGLPRNVGIQYARGKYIAFLDSDDLYTKTALEELSSLAEEYQADVVDTDYRFNLYDGRALNISDPQMTDFYELTNPANFTLKTYKRTPVDQTIRFETNDMAERIRRWIIWDYHWGTPSLFFKRHFLIHNQIFFAKIRMFEDMSFFFECLCKAEKFLRVPNSFYIVRTRVGSTTNNKDNFIIQKIFEDYLRVALGGFNEFERIMNEISFFKGNNYYRYAVLDFFFNRSYAWPWSFQNIYAQIPAFKLNELVKKEFHPDDAPLAAYLFNTFNVYRLQIMKLQQELAALKKTNQ